jgi:flagellar hook assembly protein FlgD
VPEGAAIAGAAPGIVSIVPNPALGPASVIYRTPAAGNATLRVFDVSGRQVAELQSGFVPAGEHVARWTGRDARGRALAPGVYRVSLEAKDRRSDRVLIRLGSR